MWLSVFMTWISNFFSNKPTSSMKRLGYFLGVIFSILWLSTDYLMHKTFSQMWVDIYNTFMYVAGGSYVLGKSVETLAPKKEEKVEE